MAFSSFPLHRPRSPHRVQLPLQARNSLLHPAAVDFQLRLSRTARADAAGLPREVVPHASEARQQILQLRQLNLQAPLPTARALRKNVENELGAIEHLAGKQVLQIAPLRRRKLVVENDRCYLPMLKRLLD